MALAHGALIPGCAKLMILNFFYWMGIYFWVRGFARGKRDCILAALTVGYTGIVIALEILSVFGGISFPYVAAVSTLVGISGLFVNERSRRRGTRRIATEPETSHSIRSFASLAVFVPAWILLWVSVSHLVVAVSRPVPVDGDAPIYHLPFAIQWAKAGSLIFVPTPFGEESASYFPANGELWFTWLLVTGSGQGTVKVGQWPFLLMGAVALYALARERGASKEAAVLPASFWAMLPLTFNQSIRANVDLIWTAFYFIGLHFSLRYQEGLDRGERNRSDLIFAALAMGCVLGTKSVGLVFVPLIALPLAWRILTQSRQYRDLGWLIAGICLPAAFWFFRNAWWTGNPVYPLDVSVFGARLFAGWYGRAEMAATTYHLPVSAWRVLLARLCVVMGPLFAATWALSIAIGLSRSKYLFKLDSPRTNVRTFAGLAVLQVVIYWFVIPYNTQERFLLPAMGLGLLPLAALITSRPQIAFGLVLVPLVHFGGSRAFAGFVPMDLGLPLWSSELGAGGVACIVAIAVILMWLVFAEGQFPANRFPILSRTACAIGVFCAACLWTGWTSTHPGQFYPRTGFGAQMLEGWQIVEKSSPPGGQRIAYCGTNLPYYLFGVGLRNETHYVAINDKAEWRPHDFHAARRQANLPDRSVIPWPHWDREEADYAAWLENLVHRRIDVLFIARVNLHGRLVRPSPGLPEFPIERKWADAHPEHFEFLGPHPSEDVTPWTRVYRLKKSPGDDKATME